MDFKAGFYLHLSNIDHENKYPFNTQSSFYQKLPREYLCKGTWVCGICDINFEQKFKDGVSTPSYVLVCTDFVSESYVNGNLTPILRKIPIEVNGGIYCETYPLVQYRAVSKNYISEISVKVTNERGNLADIESELSLTLHFKRVF